MKNFILYLFISGFFLALLTAHAAELSGTVTQNGQPVEGALVKAHFIKQDKVSAVKITRSASNGRYTLQGLRSGKHVVIVEVRGKRVFQGSIDLDEGKYRRDLAVMIR